ncbi:hypothetical protein B6I21_09100 [candidate division KSB1 bacterium 4572_119]|nr:MAG: hypothetical protein B6I21_09100 [candidate division KSB1 bacterium 4572_119]
MKKKNKIEGIMLKHREKAQKFLLFFILGGVLILLLGNAIAENSSPAGLIHFPVKNAVEDRSISIEARLEQYAVQQVQYVRVYFRTRGQSDYRFLEMDEQLESFSGEIPEDVVKSPGVEYFILALLADGTMATSPSSNPFYAPHEVAVTPGSEIGITPPDELPAKIDTKPITTGDEDFQATILSPESDERVAEKDALIAVSFLGEVSKLDLKSIKLFVDNKNVTSTATITENMLTYIPRTLLPGSHQVKLELADSDGVRFPDMVWRFYIVSEKEAARQQQKLPFKGDVYAEFRNEKFADTTYSVTNFGGKIRGKLGPLKYRGRVFITSREDKAFQPRNRMLIEAGTSWIGIKFGDTHPTFNELMLWGRRVRGIEAYIKFGFFNVEFVTGQTYRKIEGMPYTDDPANQPPNYLHPETGLPVTSTTGIYKYGTYQQNLMAIRPSFGSGKNFQLALNLVKVKDDAESIQHSTKPKDNIVLGPDLTLAFDNHRIEFKASAAFSLLADDISNGALSSDDLEEQFGELPFDPAQYEQYFVINTSLIPLDPTGLTSLAYQGSFKFNYFNNNINVIYKSVGSAYNALANSFMRKDIQGFSAYDRIRLYRNQIYLNLGFEKYMEEVSAEGNGDDSTAPSDYSALNIGVSLFPQAKYWPRLNVNWKNYDRNNGLDHIQYPNSVNYKNTDLSFQLGYDSLRTNYQFPLTTVISFANNNNIAGGGSFDFKYSMFSVNGTYRLLKYNVVLKAGFSSTGAVGVNTTMQNVDGSGTLTPVTQNYTDYQRTAFNFGGDYRFLKRHSILWDMSIITLDDKVTGNYQNNFFRVRYQMRY